MKLSAGLQTATWNRLKAGDGWLRWLESGPVIIRPRSDVAIKFPTGAAALAWLKRGFEIGAESAARLPQPAFERVTLPDGTIYHRARFPRSATPEAPRKPTPAVAQFYRSAKSGGWAVRMVHA